MKAFGFDLQRNYSRSDLVYSNHVDSSTLSVSVERNGDWLCRVNIGLFSIVAGRGSTPEEAIANCEEHAREIKPGLAELGGRI